MLDRGRNNLKKCLLLPLIIIILLVSGCTRETTVDVGYSTTINGQDILILFNEGTRSEGTIISDNGIYTFAYYLDGTFAVVYPNGYRYTFRDINGAIASSWSLNESAEELGFIDGMNLELAVRSASRATQGSQRTVSPLVSILLIGLGLLNILKPKSIWWISRGWMFKNVEPSDLVLGVYRIIGIIVAFVGLISFFA